jgi:hypothetical protein
MGTDAGKRQKVKKNQEGADVIDIDTAKRM